jgi:hypothetical protein
MAFQRAGIDAGMQERLREMAAQVRLALYGPDGCPEWGTRFREIEQQGMNVGLELARLVMEQSVSTQSERVPDSALVVEGDEVRSAGRETTPLETEAGPITWDQPRTMLKHGRKAFFPPVPSAGTEGG